MTGRAEIVETSVAVLSESGDLRRRPRAPWRKRPDVFNRGFDGLTLFHDCFRHADGERVLLVGPALRNLRRAVDHSRWTVDGTATDLRVSVHTSITVTIVALSGVSPDARAIGMEVGDQSFTLTIQPNFSDRLAGRRLLFTTSRNNKPEWLTAWAQYHHRFHGVDAVVLFDNGSTTLDVGSIAGALERSGVPEIFVVPWDRIYGAYDPKVLINPYWARFLPMSAMSVALRRFGAKARGILNCDVDELVHAEAAPDIFAALDRTPQGLLVMRGRWIEAAPSTDRFGDHRDYHYRLKDAEAARCAQRKWVLDPRRPWVADLGVHPYFHWIEGRPRGAKSMPSDVFYWHFKAINTNWKTARNVPSDAGVNLVEPDPELSAVFSAWGKEPDRITA
jgi:hypothetical protein